MKNITGYILTALIVFSFQQYSHAATDPSFDKTVVIVQKALLTRDLATLDKHVDVAAIVRSKIKKYAKKSEKKGILMQSAGKLINFSEPIITGSIVKLAMSEYSKSSGELRSAYMRNVKIERTGSLDQIAFARGIFLRKPFLASAVKVNGSWVVNSVESEWIDIEIKNALRSMHVI